MLFFIVLGGVAVLEVHRALQTSGNKDAQEIKKKEEELRRQLRELQKELHHTKSQRELTEREAAQLSERNSKLLHDKENLERQRSSLQVANEELSRKADSLLEHQAMLEQSEESLKEENANLLQQFDQLKIKYEEESSSFHEQLSELKQQVSSALQRFTSGDFSAEALLAFLSDMGVEVRCRPEDLRQLPGQLHSAHSREERLQLLDKVELRVDDSWLHQLRLSSCPERAARLLMASRETSLSARGPAPSGGPALTYHRQSKKLHTPNKSGEASGANKVGLLKLGAGMSAAALSVEAKENHPQQQAVQRPSCPSSSASEPLGPIQENKSRSLVFLPTKKVGGSKGRASLTTPRLEMDVSLGEHAAAAPSANNASSNGVTGGDGTSARGMIGWPRIGRKGPLGQLADHSAMEDELMGDNMALMSR